jgi:hypothetical protein
MIETVSSSETSVSFYQTTRRNLPEDADLQVQRLTALSAVMKVVRFRTPCRYVGHVDASPLSRREECESVYRLVVSGSILRLSSSRPTARHSCSYSGGPAFGSRPQDRFPQDSCCYSAPLGKGWKNTLK